MCRRFLSNGCGILETISDEYTNTPVLLYAVRGPSSVMNPSSRKHTVVRDLHDAVSFSRLSFFGKMTILVCPSLGVKPQLSSTLKMRIPYAVALHSTSLPSRIPLGPTADSSDVSGAVYISGSVKMLAAGQSRQNMVAILDVARPNPSLTGRWDEQNLLVCLQSWTPEVAEDVDDLQAVESLIVHGAIGSGGRNVSVSEVRMQSMCI